jgi:GalNAc-alpha-(1->4)-GalNAc-alpha-(1->3)-diNAcBac-PP-undecaprenol alpha-1,4-N-acetyl-D-galactosaminyltransferase
MRITFVIHSLAPGGAERVASNMANYWARNGCQITLLTLKGETEPPFYELHPAVALHPLGLPGKSDNLFKELGNNWYRLSAVRNAIRASRPDVVISFMDLTNVLVLLAAVGLRIPTIVTEHSDPHMHLIGKGWDLLRSFSYRWARRLVVLNQSVLDYFSPAVRKRGRVIPNAVVLPDSLGSATQPAVTRRNRLILAMGRLSREKGFDLLLEAFAQVVLAHPDWSLEIWGEGPLRADLEASRDELGLRERVAFLGLSRQPFEKMMQAELFVLSSRYEGFSMVLCEAMACGLPVISFDCPSGPRGIVRDGIDGILVPAADVIALAAALDRLMGDDAERRRLAERAPEVVVRFGEAAVMQTWDELLREVVP